MKNYYDPMLFASTPEHPGTCGVMAVLKEPVDGEILKEAAEELRSRFPYFYVRPVMEDGDLAVGPNPLPLTVRNTWEPSFLMSRDVNYHMAALKYEGKALALEISHLLTDGAGMIPFFKSILFCYLRRKTGKDFDPEGFRLPGQLIPPSETENPFSGIDLDNAKPFYKKKKVINFYRLGKKVNSAGDNEKVFFLKLPEKDLIRLCGESDSSPNILLSVLLARAVRRIDPDSQKTILCAIAINHKAMLGNFDNYRAFSDTADIDFPKDREHDSISRMCTIARGQLMLQAQPENSAAYVKQVKDASRIMERIPLPVRIELMKKIMDMSRATFGISYPGRKGYGPLDPYISEFYYLAEPAVYDLLVETACMNGTFFVTFIQKFSSEEFFEAFLRELEEAGIEARLVRKEEGRMLSGVRYDDMPSMKPVSEIVKSGFADTGKSVKKLVSQAGDVLERIFMAPL